MAKQSKDTKKKLFAAYMVIAVIGLIVTGILLYKHFGGDGVDEFCSFGTNFDCGIVNKSPYAKVDGIFYFMVIDLGWQMPIPNIPIPVSLMGMFTVLILMGMMEAVHTNTNVFGIKPHKMLNYIRGMLIFGLIFSLYLFLVEVYILKTYCIFCLILDVVLIAMTIISFMYKGDN